MQTHSGPKGDWRALEGFTSLRLQYRAAKPARMVSHAEKEQRGKGKVFSSFSSLGVDESRRVNFKIVAKPLNTSFQHQSRESFTVK